MPYIFFAINVGAACFFIETSVDAAPLTSNGHDEIGVMAGYVYGGFLAATEFFLLIQLSVVLNRFIAQAWVVIGVLGYFAVCSMFYEGYQKGGWPAGFGWFVLVCGLIATYFVACGTYRLNRDRRLSLAPSAPN